MKKTHLGVGEVTKSRLQEETQHRLLEDLHPGFLELLPEHWDHDDSA